MRTVVLDDDPTGTQAATGVTVLFDLGLLETDPAALVDALRADGAVYVQTNSRAIDGAAAARFAAGIAARTKGKVLWCITRPDLFAPALAQAGLPPDRVIYVEAGDDKTVLACVEEGLRHGGLGAVVAEIGRLSMTASRRLQLAAEGTGAIGLALRRWRRQTEATDFGQPTAAMTRWRVSALPSPTLPVPGVGRHRWLVELIRARAGESADFELEACDDTGRLALPAHMVNRSRAQDGRRRGASG